MPQKKRTPAEWETIMSAQRASGQSQKAWCEANGVSYHTFLDRTWRMRRQEEKKPKLQQWVGVQEASKVQTTDAIRIEMGSFCVLVSEEFNESALLRVCKTLLHLC